MLVIMVEKRLEKQRMEGFSVQQLNNKVQSRMELKREEAFAFLQKKVCLFVTLIQRTICTILLFAHAFL